MLKIIFLNKEDLCIFLNNFKERVLINKDSLLIDKKDFYLANRTIKRFKLSAQIIIKTVDKRVILNKAIVLICIALIFTFSIVLNFTFKEVVINTKSDYLKLEIKEFLDKNNYSLDSENILNIKEEILKNFPEVGLLEIHQKMGKTIIDIYEVSTSSQIEQKKDRIISYYDGIVDRVVLREGSSLVKRGDVIKKGDILIDGYILNNEEKIKTKADGEVYAKCYEKESFFINRNTYKKVYKKTIDRKISFSAKREKNKMENVEVRTKKISLFPFHFYYSEYIKYENIKLFLSDEDIYEIALNRVCEKREECRNSKLLNYVIKQKNMDSFCQLVIYYEIEQCISIEEEGL